MDAENGTLSGEGDVATLTYHRRLSHPVEEVWAALTCSRRSTDSDISVI